MGGGGLADLLSPVINGYFGGHAADKYLLIPLTILERTNPNLSSLHDQKTQLDFIFVYTVPFVNAHSTCNGENCENKFLIKYPGDQNYTTQGI